GVLGVVGEQAPPEDEAVPERTRPEPACYGPGRKALEGQPEAVAERRAEQQSGETVDIWTRVSHTSRTGRSRRSFRSDHERTTAGHAAAAVSSASRFRMAASSLRMILPVGFRGRASTMRTSRGALYPARFSRQRVMSSRLRASAASSSRLTP